MITMLRQFQIGQQIREEGPRTHLSKRGTPTMGGVLIILSVVISTLLWSNLSVVYVWIAVGATLRYGGDRVCRRLPEDQAPSQPRAHGQAEARAPIHRGDRHRSCAEVLDYYSTSLSVPFLKTFVPEIWWPIYLLVFTPVVIVGFSNAVNLTDGLDGLAISVTMVTAAALTAFTYIRGTRCSRNTSGWSTTRTFTS